MRYVAISDIHGERGKLQQLMLNLSRETDPRRDVYVFLGDYVDGGPDTKGVVNELMAYQKQYPHWVFLKGNHEDMLLDAIVFNSRKYWHFSQWYGQGGKETAESYYPPGLSDYDRETARPADYIPYEHLEWMMNRPLTYETDNFIFVHAGLLPGGTVETTPEDDKLWLRREFFTSDYDWGKRIIFGHTVFEKPLVRPNMIGLDTMYHGHGSITAVILDDDNPQSQRFITSDVENWWRFDEEA